MRVVVFDLDGTLIAGNSFHQWLFALTLWLLKRGRLLSCLRLLFWIGARGVRYIPHLELKRQIIALSVDVNPSKAMVSAFVDKLVAVVRPELLQKIREHKQEGARVAVATAAIDLYLPGFAEYCGADDLIATSSRLSPSWQENLKARKLQSIQEYYGKDVVIDAVYSDHSDDLPLFRAAKRAIVVAPSTLQWKLLQESGLVCERIL